MLQTKAFLSFCCVGFASRGSADPLRTVLGAHIFARDTGGAAVGSSASYLLAVLSATPTSLSKRLAALNVAHFFVAATAMPDAQSS